MVVGKWNIGQSIKDRFASYCQLPRQKTKLMGTFLALMVWENGVCHSDLRTMLYYSFPKGDGSGEDEKGLWRLLFSQVFEQEPDELNLLVRPILG